LDCDDPMAKQTINKPLDGILVIDFSQFLSGPSAALRLADLGARVIKVERPESGDICRTLYISNLELDGDSSIFHAINRNKESFAADLKKPKDIQRVKQLLQKADVIIQNFRPGVMKRLGLDYQSVKQFNPGVIYGEITGYGDEGPWKETPGQDLLVQSRSGLTWLGGIPSPLPMGLVVDMAAGAHLTQGILAGLVRKSISGQGSLIEVSLPESIFDMQLESLTPYLNGRGPNQHGTAPAQENYHIDSYSGFYETSDGFIALETSSLKALHNLLKSLELAIPQKPDALFSDNSEIKSIISDKLILKSTRIFDAADFGCEEVLTWEQLLKHEGFIVLDMLQEIRRCNGHTMKTTRCPIRIDGQIYKSTKGSPRIGENTFNIMTDLLSIKEGEGHEN
jgi:CoA:oxalate CoA-transferase